VSPAKTVGMVAAVLCLAGAAFAVGHRVGGRSVSALDQGAGVESVAVSPAPSTAVETFARMDPRESQVYYPFMNMQSPSLGGIAAAKGLLAYLDTGDRTHLERAHKAFVGLQEFEKWGGEYSTLQWFCEYVLADDSTRVTMLDNDEGRRFVELFGGDDWALLRRYVLAKYRLSRDDPEWLLHTDEIVRFNSPYRQVWERGDLVLEAMALEPGMRVADIGSGPGYYSFRFADLVGSTGRVYAVEMIPQHMDYVRFVASSEGLDQIAVTPTEGPFPQVEDGSLDRVFLCAAYQTIYLSIRDDERAAWMAAMKRALAPDGLLVVVENEPVLGPDVVPFGGISVSRPLLEAQLLAYGFELVSAERFVEQRYTLVLRKAD
jgi:ubiquinone/menaquinone biosynthesis C-methylase UbiE